MSELENIEHDKQVYAKWLCEDKSNPIRAIHWLWEYLETPRQEDNKLSEDDELDILQSFINYKRGNQPQLTIPKIIADILGKYDEYNPTADELIMMAYRDYQEFHDWFRNEWSKNDNIAKAYLAGKALGVDLVKVVEGYALDEPIAGKRVIARKGAELIPKILDVVGVETWEQLNGQYIRVEDNGLGTKVSKIGHLMDNKWLDFESFFKEVMD